MFSNFPTPPASQLPNTMPSRFRCSVDGKWEPASAFSKKQIEMWRVKSKSGRSTSYNPVMICRAHNGEPPEELQCRGLCQQWKSVSDFSGNQRKGDRWCRVCMTFKEGCEDNVVPFPTPNGVRSVEETITVRYGNREGVPQLTDEMIIENYVAQTHNVAHPLSTASDNGSESTTRGRELSLSREGQFIGRERSTAGAPHHMLQSIKTRSLSRAPSTAYWPDSAPSVDDQKAIPFTAWGPDGEVSHRLKDQTIESDLTFSVGRLDDESTRAGWAKPKQRKNPYKLPVYLDQAPYQEVEVHYEEGSEDEC